MDLNIIVSGNPVDGLDFHGPFEDAEHAMEWAERNCDMWWLALMETPTTSYAAQGDKTR